MILLAALLSLAYGADFFIETGPLPERQAAVDVQAAVAGAGMEPRLVRRFKLGRGWEFVVLVEHFPSEEEAAAAMVRLAPLVGQSFSLFRVEDQRVIAVAAPAAPTPDVPPQSQIPGLVARLEAAHGSDSGGSRALARAGAVHFVFTRTVLLGGKAAKVRHDYWRQGALRRLAIDTGGAGTDSLAVATGSGAWLRVGSTVQTRDLGVLIGIVDAFAPEAVCTLALDVASLLSAPEVEHFRVLEGAESGIRIGQGGDESEPGLSFLDMDAVTGRLLRARYVTEAGPVTFEVSAWREVAPGILAPDSLRIERADGRVEVVQVERFDVSATAPPGVFDRPL